MELPRKIALLLLVCLSVVVLLVGCGKEPQNTAGGDESWNKIKTQGYFTVGLDDAFPPMGFRDIREASFAVFMGNAGANGSTPSNRFGSVINIGMTICFMGRCCGIKSALIVSNSSTARKNVFRAAGRPVSRVS